MATVVENSRLFAQRTVRRPNPPSPQSGGRPALPPPAWPALSPLHTLPFPWKVVPAEPPDGPCFAALCRPPPPPTHTRVWRGGGGGGWGPQPLPVVQRPQEQFLIRPMLQAPTDPTVRSQDLLECQQPPDPQRASKAGDTAVPAHVPGRDAHPLAGHCSPCSRSHMWAAVRGLMAVARGRAMTSEQAPGSGRPALPDHEAEQHDCPVPRPSGLSTATRPHRAMVSGRHRRPACRRARLEGQSVCCVDCGGRGGHVGTPARSRLGWGWGCV